MSTLCAGGRELAGSRVGWTEPCPYEATESAWMTLLNGQEVLLNMCGWHLHDCNAVPITEEPVKLCVCGHDVHQHYFQGPRPCLHCDCKSLKVRR